MISVAENKAAVNGQEKVAVEKQRRDAVKASVAQSQKLKDGYVQIPRSFIRDIMPRLSEGELKLALAVYEKTVGRGSESNAVPIHQFEQVTGLKRSSACHAMARLVAMDVVKREARWDKAGDRAASVYRPGIMPTYEKKEAASPPESGGGGVVLPGAPPSAPRDTTGSAPQSTRVVLPEATSIESLRIENKTIESSSSVFPTVVEPEPVEDIHDDDLIYFSNSKTKLLTTEEVVYSLRAARSGTSVDLLTMRRGGRKKADLTGVPTLDGPHAMKIYGCFESDEDYGAWLQETMKRELAKRADNRGWGLWLTDAQQRAPEIRAEMVAESKRQADIQIERERVMESELARGRACEELIEPEHAIDRAQSEINIAKAKKEHGHIREIPEIVKRRLIRIGERINAEQVLHEAINWQKCGACGDKGIVGSALNRTLEWCTCLAGKECLTPKESGHRGVIEYGERDQGYPEREMERVHSTLQNQLVAACFENPETVMTGDALAAAEFIDHGDTIEVCVRKAYSLTLFGRDFPKELRQVLLSLGCDRKLHLWCPDRPDHKAVDVSVEGPKAPRKDVGAWFMEASPKMEMSA